MAKIKLDGAAREEAAAIFRELIKSREGKNPIASFWITPERMARLTGGTNVRAEIADVLINIIEVLPPLERVSSGAAWMHWKTR